MVESAAKKAPSLILRLSSVYFAHSVTETSLHASFALHYRQLPRSRHLLWIIPVNCNRGHTTRVNPPHQRSRQENPPFALLDLTSRILFKNSKTAPDSCSIATRNSRLFVGLSFVPLDDLS